MPVISKIDSEFLLLSLLYQVAPVLSRAKLLKINKKITDKGACIYSEGWYNRRMSSNHLYSVTISRSSARTLNAITASLPAKYFNAYCSADAVASCLEAPAPKARSLGSVEMFFACDSTLANALRKWMQRRFKSRSKFARQVVPVQFCACIDSNAGKWDAAGYKI